MFSEDEVLNDAPLPRETVHVEAGVITVDPLAFRDLMHSDTRKSLFEDWSGTKIEVTWPVYEWNRWLERVPFTANGEPRVRIRDLRLQRTDMTGIDLRGALIERAYLQGVELRSADMAQTSWCGPSRLEQLDLDNANLRLCAFDESSLVLCAFAGSRLCGTLFRGCPLDRTVFSDIKADSVVPVAHLGSVGVAFDHCLLDAVSLRGCRLESAKLVDCGFSELLISGSSLLRAHFIRPNFRMLGEKLSMNSAFVKTRIEKSSFVDVEGKRNVAFEGVTVVDSEGVFQRSGGVIEEPDELKPLAF